MELGFRIIQIAFTVLQFQIFRKIFIFGGKDIFLALQKFENIKDHHIPHFLTKKSEDSKLPSSVQVQCQFRSGDEIIKIKKVFRN